MSAIAKTLKRIFSIGRPVFRRSYFPEEEKIIYTTFFENRKSYKGFYIDVGAQHPYRFSSTLPFYQREWKGMNIEPAPAALSLFEIFRKGDINLNLGVSLTGGIRPFYCFKDPALNSFSSEKSAHHAAAKQYAVTEVVDVNTMPLAQLLDRFLPAGTTIDVLNIDTEEYDLEVLRSNDWNKYNPLFIMIEVVITQEHLMETEIYKYLLARNYELINKTSRICFFKLTTPVK